MRDLFYIPSLLLAASFAMAQTVPQGPSPLVLEVPVSATNTEMNIASPMAREDAPGPSLIGIKGKSADAVLPTGITTLDVSPGFMPQMTSGQELAQPVVQPESPVFGDDASRQARDVRVSFLMDTGVQYADEGEYQEAEQAYLRALESDPNNPNIRFRLATLYITMKRYKEAAASLNALALEFPESPIIHNNLAWIYATGGEMKNGKLALRHAREALLSEPTAASVWNTLAEAYYVFGQYDNALRASDCSIDLLKAQGADEKAVAEFENQRAKIQRGKDAYTQFFGLDDEK